MKDTTRHIDSRYALFVAFVLNLAYVLSYLDRHILALLIEPIRIDLQLSDTQVSLLTGLAFVAGYSFLLVPIGYLADRYHRKRIIALGVTSWSLFTSWCGLASSFTGLFMLRAGVGLGEAMLLPPTYSMLADYFSKKNIQKAMSIFVIGAPLGGALALLVGGWLIDMANGWLPLTIPGLEGLQAWQVVFILIGALGVVVLLLLLFVVEPVRKDMLPVDGVVSKTLPKGALSAFIRERKQLFIYMVSGLSLMNITAFGALTWLPTLFIRIHGWSAADAGIRIGLLSLVFGVSGPLVALWLSNHFLRKGQTEATIKVAVIGAGILCVGAVATPLVTQAWVALALAALILLGVYVTSGIIPTLIQNIAPNQMRGKLSSLLVLVINFLGIGAGPTLVALCNDYLFRDPMALGRSMTLVFAVTMVIGLSLTLLAVIPFRQAVERANAWEGITEQAGMASKA